MDREILAEILPGEKQWCFPQPESWGRGPWSHEPDKTQWKDPASGLVCLAVRNPFLGFLCGYAGLPESHPYYRRRYIKLPSLEVHFGLSFSDFSSGGENGVGHHAEPGDPEKLWWLGFDCGHYRDKIPGFSRLTRGLGDTYRTLAYVHKECARLAAQLHQVTTDQGRYGTSDPR